MFVSAALNLDINLSTFAAAALSSASLILTSAAINFLTLLAITNSFVSSVNASYASLAALTLDI